MELDFRDDETVWIWIPSYGTKYVEYLKSEVERLPDSDFKQEVLDGFKLQ